MIAGKNVKHLGIILVNDVKDYFEEIYQTFKKEFKEGL